MSKALRGFTASSPTVATSIDVAEIDDGSVQFSLVTPRDGMAPLVTSFRLAPATFDLLSQAMYMAAHDRSVWHELQDDAAMAGKPIDG